MTKTIALPKNVTEADLKYPSWKSKNKMVDQFDMYFTERFGWCITTLFISKGQRGQGNRSYGISLNGELVSVGNGPHVLRQATVYVKQSRLKKLQALLDLKKEGEVRANQVRDQRSTRIARTKAYRSSFGMNMGF